MCDVRSHPFLPIQCVWFWCGGVAVAGLMSTRPCESSLIKSRIANFAAPRSDPHVSDSHAIPLSPPIFDNFGLVCKHRAVRWDAAHRKFIFAHRLKESGNKAAA